MRERLRQYAASRPHPAAPRNVAGATQAVKVAAPAPALALGAPGATAQAECGCCTTAVTCRSCRSGFSGYCFGGASAVTSAASPTTASSATPASAASQAGTQKSATRPARRRPATVSRKEVTAGKSHRRKVNQDPVKRDGGGHVDRNDVRVNIRKIVREGFNLPGS